MAEQAGLSCGVAEGLLGRVVYNLESGGKTATLHAPLPRVYSQVFILKGVKVACFHTLLQVFILKELRDCCRMLIHKQKCGCLIGKLAAGKFGTNL